VSSTDALLESSHSYISQQTSRQEDQTCTDTQGTGKGALVGGIDLIVRVVALRHIAQPPASILLPSLGQQWLQHFTHIDNSGTQINAWFSDQGVDPVFYLRMKGDDVWGLCKLPAITMGIPDAAGQRHCHQGDNFLKILLITSIQ